MSVIHREAPPSAMYDRAVETCPPELQFHKDRVSYARQVEYLFQHSEFYRGKLRAAGFRDRDSVGALDDIAQLPFTEKDELRR